MTAKILFTQHGTDPSPIAWPPNSPPAETFILTTAVVSTIPVLIAYPATGQATFADGRQYPGVSVQGSTFALVFP
jgi:hypothetical protein